MAENAPFARTMLCDLLGRLQSRFTSRISATSKADIWRLAAVDPLMVSHRHRLWASLGSQGRTLSTSHFLCVDPVCHLPAHGEDGQGQQIPRPVS